MVTIACRNQLIAFVPGFPWTSGARARARLRMSTGAISDECVYDLDVDGVGEPVRVAQDPLAKLSAGSGTTGAVL